MDIFLGIDIGGSSIKYGWGNCEEGLQSYQTLVLQRKNRDDFLALVQEMFNNVDSKIGLNNLKGIGMGMPGAIDKITGLVTTNNPNLPFWVNHHPSELLPENCNIPFAFDNDANLMALAESYTQKKDYVAGVTIGSGIGCGIIIEGRIYHGAYGFAGELGHICVVDKGLRCNCGKNGCLEAYASGEGLRRRLALKNPCYAEMDLPAILAIKETDTLVGDYIKQGQLMLTAALSGLATCLDPEIIIIGGGAMDLGLYCIWELKEEIIKKLPAAHSTHLKVTKAINGNKAGVLGAIKLIEDKFNSN
ncbi:MAG: ROK family protein [Candidatus Cloacimonas sp.]|jgi:glucokinase|nr:ROK family protein [Candidatus Cloacimonas sp.]HNQ39449.1 ROK family protein [Candidatus Cloacimonas sp.]HNS85119.1 ROK family protein [Candidatus Cloacimonas sp.]HPB19023.1 ROK family protein [Candidatus Cloacimonas sp.]